MGTRWLTTLLLMAGCGGVEEPPTFEEFKALVYQEPDTGMWIVNGDILVEDELQLREEYDRFIVSFNEAQGFGTSEHGLAVNRVSGRDDKWSSSAAQNITYCVSQSSFGSRYNTVVNAMSNAASAWEGAADVNFVHSSGQDGNCNRQNGNVVFDVRQVCTGQYLARAFFPSTRRRNRNVLIDCTSFGNISPWSLTGVLRHELGHAIGMRHEHTRPEAGVCFEDNQWRALTNYDSASVMHYPQCNGSNNGDLVLTNLDRQGAAALYP